MGAVSGDAIDHKALAAKLRPAGAAVFTGTATKIVMIQHPLADACQARINAGTDFDDDTARLMAGDDRFGDLAEPQCPLHFAWRGAVEFQVTAAHAGSLDLDDHLAGTGSGISKPMYLDASVTGKIQRRAYVISCCPLAGAYR